MGFTITGSGSLFPLLLSTAEAIQTATEDSAATAQHQTSDQPRQGRVWNQEEIRN